ncbi:10659_t:CDS:2, partial [Funneliformis geosporum]
SVTANVKSMEVYNLTINSASGTTAAHSKTSVTANVKSMEVYNLTINSASGTTAAHSKTRPGPQQPIPKRRIQYTISSTSGTTAAHSKTDVWDVWMNFIGVIRIIDVVP